jgi:hypothetical protein
VEQKGASLFSAILMPRQSVRKAASNRRLLAAGKIITPLPANSEIKRKIGFAIEIREYKQNIKDEN